MSDYQKALITISKALDAHGFNATAREIRIALRVMEAIPSYEHEAVLAAIFGKEENTDAK